MPLSKTEICRRATAFVQEWREANNEDADSQSFWEACSNHAGCILADVYNPLRPVRTHQPICLAIDKCCHMKTYTSGKGKKLFERY